MIMQRFNSGKIYRWRCDRPNNTINECLCDEEVNEWKRYATVSMNHGECIDICCGEYFVVLSMTRRNQALRILTMSDNPIVGEMWYGAKMDGKVFMVES